MPAARTLALLALILLVFGPASAAGAQSDKEIKRQLDECLGNRMWPNGPPSCTFDEEGNLIDRDIPGEAPSGGSFGGLLTLALLWSALPMIIGGSIAASRGQSVGLAILVTLFLGWLGLALVALLQRQEVVETATEVVQRAREPRFDAVDQIRRLAELRDEGLLTEEEFRSKKRQVLEAT